MESGSTASVAGLAARVLRALESHDVDFAVAESCTGGAVARALTGVPGASRRFWGGVVVYSAAAKRVMLGVETTAAGPDGVVSEATTRRLARALRDRSGVRCAAAVTGWAGPRSEDCQPVGTVHLAVARSTGEIARTLRLEGDREAVREGATIALLQLTLDSLDRPAIGEEPSPPAEHRP